MTTLTIAANVSQAPDSDDMRAMKITVNNEYLTSIFLSNTV